MRVQRLAGGSGRRRTWGRAVWEDLVAHLQPKSCNQVREERHTHSLVKLHIVCGADKGHQGSKDGNRLGGDATSVTQGGKVVRSGGMKTRCGVEAVISNKTETFGLRVRGKTDTLFTVVLGVKNKPADAEDARDMGSIPESGRFPGGGSGYPLQYPCQENPVNRGGWRATVHGTAESDSTDRLSIRWGWGRGRHRKRDAKDSVNPSIHISHSTGTTMLRQTLFLLFPFCG